MPHEPIIRLAHLEEIIALRGGVLRPGLSLSLVRFDGDEDPETRHWLARDADAVVGCVTVLRRTEPVGLPFPFQLRGMAVAESHRNQGLGRRLLDRVHADVAAPMWCNARQRAAPFYARAGWSIVGEAFELPGIGPHFRMVRGH